MAKKILAGDIKQVAKSSAKDETLAKLLEEQIKFGHDKPVQTYLKSK